MKPVGYQSMPSSVNGGHQNMPLDHVLSTSNVMYCEKCGFASTDSAVFKKHMIEHMGTRFYCFYCNNVSFSEAELNAHLKQHTAKYPFKCPHCGQGYMRRLCLVKHIERLHSKNISQGPAKPGMTKISHVPVSSALPSVPTADPSSVRPAVRVTIPTPSAPAVRLGKDEQRGKALDTNISNGTNGNTELLSPLNGLIQHNRALTVSLPEEVTIPAGCLVELVEVKTVNGTKELKLRLVTQQENESVIKDTRTTVSQNTPLGKPLSSTLNHAKTVKSVSMGSCTVSRKQCETKMVNVERPAVVPVSVSKNLQNQASKEKSGFKRSSQEIINLECNTVIPNKIPKIILNPVRDGNSGIRVPQREAVNLNAAPSTVITTRVANRLSSSLHPDNIAKSVSQRAVEERKNLIPEHSQSIPARRASDTKNIPRDVSMAVKLEPGEIRLRNNIASKLMKEAVGLNQHGLKSASLSLSVPLAAAAQVRPSAILSCKDNVANQSFPTHRTLNEPSPVKANHTNSKISPWTQELRTSERVGEADMSEPEGFPVISSVFSLSQQPEEAQGSIQPLVMALRGIVMDKSNSSGCTSQDHIKINDTEQVREAPTSGYCAPVATKDTSIICNPSLTEHTTDSVKEEEHDKGIQHPPALATDHVKKEKNSTTSKDNNECSHTPASKSSTDQKSVSKIAAHADASVAIEPLQHLAKSGQDISSKFLTVSLKRVQVGVWKKSKKGLKLRISKCKTHLPIGTVTDCAVIYPMPLKVDQLVKRPGPNQPVVVLNHPKPRVSVQGVGADTIADTGASEGAPKCQILKMRLSKVMGQKYEVMGCTVRVFP